QDFRHAALLGLTDARRNLNEDERAAQWLFSFGALTKHATDRARHSFGLHHCNAARNDPMFARPLATAAAAAAVGLMLAPTPASAQAYTYQGPQNYGTGAYGQSYDYDNRYGYDRYRYDDACRSYRNDRQAGGALLGGALGAVAGSQVAARGRRTEGSILG